MVKLWRRYKPFINAGIQELITYRVNFLLYRIGDVMGAFVAFYLWKAVFDSSQESLIQGFSMADITLYIIMSFVTNLLTRSDSSFMIGEEVKDGSIIMRLLRPVHFAASYLFTELGSKWLIFISVGVPFLCVIVLVKILSGQGIVEVLGLTVLYLFSLTLAYLINFFFNICFGFSAFVFKNLWGSNLLKTSIVAFMSGSLIPLAFFPKIVSNILSFFILDLHSGYDYRWEIRCQSDSSSAFATVFLALSDGGLVSVDLEKSPVIYHHSRRLV